MRSRLRVWYDGAVFIARLIFNEAAEAKLAARGIALTDVYDVYADGAYFPRNPHPRVPGSRMMIGPDRGGRCLTIVLQPDADDEAVWHVMTGWPSTERQRDDWRRHA